MHGRESYDYSYIYYASGGVIFFFFESVCGPDSTPLKVWVYQRDLPPEP